MAEEILQQLKLQLFYSESKLNCTKAAKLFCRNSDSRERPPCDTKGTAHESVALSALKEQDQYPS